MLAYAGVCRLLSSLGRIAAMVAQLVFSSVSANSALIIRYSLYLLYWYRSTNTLLVQKYKH